MYSHTREFQTDSPETTVSANLPLSFMGTSEYMHTSFVHYLHLQLDNLDVEHDGLSC